MKKVIIMVVILAVVTVLLLTQQTKIVSNKNNEINTSNSEFEPSLINTGEGVDEVNKTIDDTIEKVSEEITEKSNEITNHTDSEIINDGPKESEKEEISTVNNEVEDIETYENIEEESKEEIQQQNDDEFYDTSDRDPFAEEQHKSDVPLVLVDKDGNEMQPETVYWDEETGRGTLDPNGYIPEGLPPGAVFVCEVDDEEVARLKEEFGD